PARSPQTRAPRDLPGALSRRRGVPVVPRRPRVHRGADAQTRGRRRRGRRDPFRDELLWTARIPEPEPAAVQANAHVDGPRPRVRDRPGVPGGAFRHGATCDRVHLVRRGGVLDRETGGFLPAPRGRGRCRDRAGSGGVQSGPGAVAGRAETARAAPETPPIFGGARDPPGPREAPPRRGRHRHGGREAPLARDGPGRPGTLLRDRIPDGHQAVLRDGQARGTRVLVFVRPRVQGRRDGLRRTAGASIRRAPRADEGEGPEPGKLRILPESV